jgi:hypothetical protein
MAQDTIADFETGLPVGWTLAGPGWTVGGTTGSEPTPQGSLFARSGAPNVLTGPLAESLTGSMTSAALSVTYSTVQWISKGWSGQFGNGLSRFEILDSTLSVRATVAAPLSDFWSQQSVDLIAAGLTPGETFYFRAIDGVAANNYAWLAVDDIRFIGAPVPEPSAAWLSLFGGAAVLLIAYRLQKDRTEYERTQ